MSLHREMASAGSGCAIANGMLNGFETTKVKLQLRNPQVYKSATMWGVMRQISQEEGVVRGLLTPGLAASLLRSTLYGAYRVGLYPLVRDSMSAQPTLGERISSGMATGALGSALSCPLDVVRTRMQADSGFVNQKGVYTTGLRRGQVVRYRGVLDAFWKILSQEGLARGLYRGASVTVARATFLNGSQLASYDTMKQYLKQSFDEGPILHVVCAFASGIIAQTVVMPIDTVKSHVMMGSTNQDFKALIWRNPRSLFRGYWPACAGQGLVMVLQMPLIEEFRRLLGVGAI